MAGGDILHRAFWSCALLGLLILRHKRRPRSGPSVNVGVMLPWQRTWPKSAFVSTHAVDIDLDLFSIQEAVAHNCLSMLLPKTVASMKSAQLRKFSSRQCAKDGLQGLYEGRDLPYPTC